MTIPYGKSHPLTFTPPPTPHCLRRLLSPPASFGLVWTRRRFHPCSYREGGNGVRSLPGAHFGRYSQVYETCNMLIWHVYRYYDMCLILIEKNIDQWITALNITPCSQMSKGPLILGVYKIKHNSPAEKNLTHSHRQRTYKRAPCLQLC